MWRSFSQRLDRIPPMRPQDQRRVVWLPLLLMLNVLASSLHVAAHLSFGLTFSLQIATVLGEIWVVWPILRHRQFGK